MRDQDKEKKYDKVKNKELIMIIIPTKHKFVCINNKISVYRILECPR